MPDFNLPAETVERAEVALNDYGNERDWQKMRPDEMAHTALTAALQLDSDVIERVARALHDNGTSGLTWQTCGEGTRNVYRDDARACLQALGLLEGGSDG